MKLDIETLANILGIVLMLQVIALYVQYRVNKAYKGIGLWLLGSTLMVAGSLLMPLVYLKSPLMLLSALANPLVVGGQVFIYWGIIRFLGVKANKRVPIVIFSIFFITYYFFVFGANSMTGRSLVISTTNMVLMMLTSYMLFRNSDKSILTSARFGAIVFAVFGAYSITRTILGFILPPTYSYDDKNAFLVFNFLAYISCSTLWTFGLIIMVNQRLNAENLEEREKIQRVFNTSPDASMITRFSDGLLVDVNAGFSALTGYTKEEVIGNSTLGINIWVHDADREVFIQELEKAGECENMEFNFQRKDGITFMGMVSAKTILIREELHVISVLRDITEQKKAEEIVRESEEMYRSILNASPDDITITDLQGRILMVSPMAKKMFGYGSDYDGFIGKRILEYIIPEDMERAQANILRMYQGGYPGPNEYHGVRKDRSLFDIEANSGIIRGASGQPVKLVFIIRDVTERKRSEQQINLLIKQLEIEKGKLVNLLSTTQLSDSLLQNKVLRQQKLDSLEKQNKELLEILAKVQNKENILGQQDKLKSEINNKIKTNKFEIGVIEKYNEILDKNSIEKWKGRTTSGVTSNFIFDCPTDFESDYLDLKLQFQDESLIPKIQYIYISFTEKNNEKQYTLLFDQIYQPQTGVNGFKVKNYFKLKKKIDLEIGYILKSESNKNYPRFERVVCRNY